MAAEIAVNGRAVDGAEAASMRPRRMAAEIACLQTMGADDPLRFNEAAANGRGNRRPPRGRPAGPATGFNEAAANGRGNRRAAGRPDARSAAASMRPRRMAAEIISVQWHARELARALQ